MASVYGDTTCQLTLAKRIEIGSLEVFDITVDYSKSFREMVEAGEYDLVNSTINQDNFPISGEGIKHRRLALFEFPVPMQFKEATAALEAEGFRPAVIEELLALGSHYPKLQFLCHRPVLALGSNYGWRAGDFTIPVLSRTKDQLGNVGRAIYIKCIFCDGGSKYFERESLYAAIEKE